MQYVGIRVLNRHGLGDGIKNLTTWTSLHDDMALISATKQQIQDKTSVLNEEAKRVKLKINVQNITEIDVCKRKEPKQD